MVCTGHRQCTVYIYYNGLCKCSIDVPCTPDIIVAVHDASLLYIHVLFSDNKFLFYLTQWTCMTSVREAIVIAHTNAGGTSGYVASLADNGAVYGVQSAREISEAVASWRTG